MMAIAHYNSLDRFPTWMWIRDDGYTLVLGAPDDSYVFYTLQFPIDRLLAYPSYVLAVLFADALILFCMYAVARRRARRTVKPVTEALDALSRGQSAKVTLGGGAGTTKRDAGGRMSAFNKRCNLLFTIGLSARFRAVPHQ